MNRSQEAEARAATVNGTISATLRALRDRQGSVDGLLKGTVDSDRVADEFRERTRSAKFGAGEELSDRAWRADDRCTGLARQSAPCHGVQAPVSEMQHTVEGS